MILYLSSVQHSNLLDFTGLYDTDGVTVKKMVGSFILKQFIIHDMRNFSHFTDVVLDRTAFGDSDTGFSEAIEEFLTMYNTRVTVICEGLSESDTLFAALLNSGVRNLVCGTEILEIQREITECLSERGMARYQPKERAMKAKGVSRYRFECRNIRIVMLSSQPRAGATTTAIGLCRWLKDMGASVCYSEMNDSGHLSYLARSYGMKQEENGWAYEDIYYKTGEQAVGAETKFNFILYDVGSQITAYTKQEAESYADIFLLQCGTKPYELLHTLRLKKRLSTEHAFILCPFVNEDVKSEYAEILNSDYHKVLFLDYQPDMMDGTVNAKQYKAVVSKYIVGV